MRYKTSCFNPTLAKHDLKRFWPLPVVIFAFFALIMIPNYYASMISIRSGTMEAATYIENGVEYAETEATQFIRQTRNVIYSFGTLVTMIQLFTALASALLVMQHIHGRKQIQFYHGLPLTRRCVYTTNAATGYLMALLPVLAVELILMILALCMGAETFPALQLMGITAASFTMYYAIAVIACVLAGQTFGAVLLYTGMNCFVIALTCGGAGVARFILYGFNEYILLSVLAQWLTPIWMIVDSAGPLYTDSGLGMPYGYPLLPFLVYALVGILLLILGGLLYKLRKGETAGEMISFPFIRGLCKVLVALMAGLGGTVVLVALMNSYEDVTFPAVVFMVMLLMLIGWIAAEMVIRKTFLVFQKKPMFRCLSLMALMLLVLTGAKLDVYGYVNRTPDLSLVSTAKVSLHGTVVEISPADALEFHKTVLDNQDELSNNTAYYGGYNIVLRYYEGEDEVMMSRSYYVPLDIENDIMQSFLSITAKPEYVYRSWFEGQDTPLTEELIDTVQVYSQGRYYDDSDTWTPYLQSEGMNLMESRLTLTNAEGMALHHAILQDIREGNLPSFYRDLVCDAPEYYGHVEYNTFTSVYDPSEGSYEEYLSDVSRNYHRIVIYSTMTNTLAVLEELGVTLNPEALK